MPLNGHLSWSVPYAPGTLVAKGYDSAGKLIGSETFATTGAPSRLRLVARRTNLAADGEDVIPVEVDVVDAAGRIVPTANNRVSFTVTGDGSIAGVGNGNPADHDPDKANFRSAFNGRCLVVVGAGEKPGSLRLNAVSPGLTTATLTMTVSSTASETSL